jgi:hypothetical protein
VKIRTELLMATNIQKKERTGKVMHMLKRFINLIWGSGSTNAKVLLEEKPGGSLHGYSETVAIVSSSDASGIVKALELGFPEERICLFDPAKKTGPQLIEIFSQYEFDYYHMMGWYPMIPRSVIERYEGYNQHMGPGGKWMDGACRMYAQMRFNEEMDENLAVPLFMQEVSPVVDDGDTVCVNYHHLIPGETAGEAQERLKYLEWGVQIEGRRSLANGTVVRKPVPRVYRTPKEKDLMDEIRCETHACFQTCEKEALNHRYSYNFFASCKHRAAG